MSDNSTQRQDGGIDSSQQTTDESGFQFAPHRESADDESSGQSDTVTLDRVKEVVEEEFDDEMWDVTEALLSAHATLLIEDVHNCTGLILVGDSGAGKSTALRLLGGLDDDVENRDDITPAAFTSLDPSRTDEELEESDLLPQIKHKTLVNSDMATWFSGDWSSIYLRMTRMARVMDGRGLVRHGGGGHGKRGHEGDYRFTFLGASTPLSPRAWEVMGHTGQRFVFHEMRSEDDDLDEVRRDMFGGKEYAERIQECQEYITEFMQELWDENGGPKTVENFDATDEAEKALVYLGQVVKYSRATLTQNENEQYEVTHRENMRRIVAILRDVARGRALLDGRNVVTEGDVEVSARIALSTMPAKRRPLIRELLNPNTGPVDAQDVENLFGVTRPTATDRIGKIVALGIGERVETDDGRNPMVLAPKSEFEWPDCLDFPRLGGA